MESCDSSSVPNELYLMKMIQNRMTEVNALNIECKAKSPKLASQRLPRYMRRRASSHNPKRLPKTLKHAVMSKMSHEQLMNMKKKKKKYKNKIKTEMSIERRESKSERSVLHVWFVKRFKMTLIWDRLIPFQNTTKNQRNLYHKSKNGVVFYYLPFWKCIEIDYSSTNRDSLINLLSHFSNSNVGFGFDAEIYENRNCEGRTVLYKPDSYPYDLISPIYFLWNISLSKLWLWAHVSAYDNLFDEFINFNANPDLKFIKRNDTLERIRLIGPQSFEALSLSLQFNCDETTKSQLSLPNSLIYVSQSDTTIRITEAECNLWNGKSDSVQSSHVIICNNNEIIKNRISYDIIISRDSVKSFWYRLTKNKGHLTGGLRDLKMLTMNTSSLMFPEIGFIDSKNNIKYNIIREIIEQNTKTLNLFVSRDETLIRSLTNNLNSFSIKNVIETHENAKSSLINVELLCCYRGVPKESDYIYLPNDDDIMLIAKKSNTIDSFDSIEDKDIRSTKERRVIGLVEFGEYSMEAARGKGIGVIALCYWDELIKINDNEKNLQKRIYALVKSSKSSAYRFVTVNVISLVYSA